MRELNFESRSWVAMNTVIVVSVKQLSWVLMVCMWAPFKQKHLMMRFSGNTTSHNSPNQKSFQNWRPISFLYTDYNISALAGESCE